MVVCRSQQIDAVFEFNDMLAWLPIFNRSQVVLRVSCTSAEPRSVMSRKHGADDDIHAIRNFLEEFVRAWNACDAYAFANLYTDPHVDVNRTPTVETRTATVAALRKRLEHSAPRLSVTSDEILVFGDWTVQRGEIRLSGNGSNRESPLHRGAAP